MSQHINKKTWEEFKNSGLLTFINTFLHIFGWCIVFSIDRDTEKVIEVFPARTDFRGFDSESTQEAYIKLSEFMKENADTLCKEAKS